MAAEVQNKDTVPDVDIAFDWAQFEQIVVRNMREAYVKHKDFNPRKYDREKVRKMLENVPNNEQRLREVSQYLLANSGGYLRLVLYFARMLTFDSVLVPLVTPEKMDTVAFRRTFEKVSKYVETYNIKHELSKIMAFVMAEDAFFGVERGQGDTTTIQRLPAEYCKITHLINGMWAYSFNMEYFNDTHTREYLDNGTYHPKFVEMYREYQKDKTANKWQLVDPEIAVCFKFHETIPYCVPPLSGTFEDILYLDDAKALAYAENFIENYKLLVQKIPMRKDARSEADMMFSIPFVTKFHNNVKSALPNEIGLASTPMDIEAITLDKVKDKGKDSVERAEENIYMSAGASSSLFNSRADNSISLNRGINVDESMLFALLRQVERHFKNKLANITPAAYQFKLWFPDLTIYNRNDMLDRYLKLAQFGFPKLPAIAAAGMSISDMSSLLAFENNFLKMTDSMVPLKSSHVATDNEAGRPLKDENDLSPKGVDQRDDAANEGRAK